jgi:hypothetical protein
MKRIISIAVLFSLFLSPVAEARRVKVVARAGFPIVRPLPRVVVRTTTTRVAPRVYLSPVVFRSVVVASLPAARVWSGNETLEREDGWTDFTLNTDRRGDRLVLEIDGGAAQISFAEVVFENGEAQVVDFNEKTFRDGRYSLLDFRNGRHIDHVRIVARAASRDSRIRVHLV